MGGFLIDFFAKQVERNEADITQCVIELNRKNHNKTLKYLIYLR